MGDSLTSGKELEEAILYVNGRDFLSRLDWARRELDDDTNAWSFITALAHSNPAKFVSLVNDLSDNLFDWVEIDALLSLGKVIPAIKQYREITNAGLKEAKNAIDERRMIRRRVGK